MKNCMADVKFSAQGLDVHNEQTAPLFEIREGGVLVGRLTVSKGGVRWLPSGFQDPPHFLNWADFDAYMKTKPRQT
jgi:hypothetical protein